MNAPAGPSAKASTDTDSFSSVPSDKNTAKYMFVTKGIAETSNGGAYSCASSPLYTMYRIWVSPPLAAQTITGSQANYYFAIGETESNAQMNLYMRWFCYVWRSGSGNVKTLIVPTSCGTEHGTSQCGCVVTATGASGDYTLTAGDRIVVEGWFDLRNTKSVSYTATGYYDGTVDPIEATTATNDASYFQCPQTLALQGVTLTKLADARLLKAATLTKTADSRLKKATTLTLTADAKLGGGTSYTIQKLADARLLKAFTLTELADARLKKAFTLTKLADARLKKAATLTELADARLKKGITLTKLADARLKKTQALSLLADAKLVYTYTITKFADARLKKTQTLTLHANATLGEGAPVTKLRLVREESFYIGSTDVSMAVLSANIDHTFGTAIATGNIVFKRALVDTLGATPVDGASVDVWRNYTIGSTGYYQHCFSGWIKSFETGKGRYTLYVEDKLVRATKYILNESFTGDVVDILYTIIHDRCGLFADISGEEPGASATVTGFNCVQRTAYDSLQALCNAIGWQMYYDPNTDTVRCKPVGVAETGFLNGYNYRSLVPIAASDDGTLTEYQVTLAVRSGTSSNVPGTVYTNGHCLNWPYDVKFTDLYGKDLPFYRVSYDANVANIMIKIPEILASDGTSFYIYYGNTSAIDRSDQAATYTFYDDFTGTTIDTVKWENHGLTVSGGVATVHKNTYAISRTRFDAGLLCEFRVNATSTPGANTQKYGFFSPASSAMIDAAGVAWDQSTTLTFETWNDEVGESHNYGAAGAYLGAYHTFRSIWRAQQVAYDIDSVGVYSVSDISYIPAKCYLLLWHNGGTDPNSLVDWVRAYKFADDQPVIGTGSAEEPAPAVTNIQLSTNDNVPAIPQWNQDAAQLFNDVTVIGGDAGPTVYQVEDPDSIAAYGRRSTSITRSDLTTVADIEAYGDAYLAWYKDPIDQANCRVRQSPLTFFWLSQLADLHDYVNGSTMTDLTVVRWTLKWPERYDEVQLGKLLTLTSDYLKLLEARLKKVESGGL